MQNRNNIIITILLALGLLALSHKTQALTPPPDGGYPGGNTAEGQNALSGPTISGYNTAIGFYSLASLTDGGYNTGVGAGTLLSSIGAENTATGAGALLTNTTGGDNTATGAFALSSNTNGAQNTATGAHALENVGGSNNTASGFESLEFNTFGNQNTAAGYRALQNNTSGSVNVAIGAGAGSALDTGDNNIDIGANVNGVAGESNTIRIGSTDITDTFIRGISGATSAGGVAVFVNSNGHLGTTTSSARFKDEIKPMGNASEAILALRPVSFRYKKEIDPQGIPEFGLIAEEVEKVNPALVIRDPEGKPYTVRYEQINAMLLNEFLKSHHKMEQQDATIARQQKQIDALTAGLQKVSAQLEVNKSAPRTVLNNP
jgi:hypothetical protein